MDVLSDLMLFLFSKKIQDGRHDVIIADDQTKKSTFKTPMGSSLTRDIVEESDLSESEMSDYQH